MKHLLRVIAETVPPPRILGGPEAPFRMLVTQVRDAPSPRILRDCAYLDVLPLPATP